MKIGQNLKISYMISNYINTNVRLYRNYSYMMGENNPFCSPIPVDYILLPPRKLAGRVKEKAISSYFNIHEINPVSLKRITKNLVKNVNYTVYIKVRYNMDSYFMAGNQFGFTYNNDKSIPELYLIMFFFFNN